MFFSVTIRKIKRLARKLGIRFEEVCFTPRDLYEKIKDDLKEEFVDCVVENVENAVCDLLKEDEEQYLEEKKRSTSLRGRKMMRRRRPRKYDPYDDDQ